MSFKSPFFSYTEIGSFPQAQAPVIAPLWADLDLTSAGLLYYRTVEDPPTLQLVANMIGSVNSDLIAYQPTLAVVATWSAAKLYGDSDQEVRFSSYCTIPCLFSSWIS